MHAFSSQQRSLVGACVLSRARRWQAYASSFTLASAMAAASIHGEPRSVSLAQLCARLDSRPRKIFLSLFRGQIADATIVLAPSLSRSFLSERSTAGLCARHCTYMIIAFCAFQLRFLEAHFRAVPEFPRQTSARVQEHDTNAAVSLRVSWNLKVTERGRVLEPAVPNACACFSRDI